MYTLIYNYTYYGVDKLVVVVVVVVVGMTLE